MFDFRLKVFDTVARRLNFTKAAAELFITQPAVTKHIKEIETYYKTRLFERNGTQIKLTAAGKTLLSHTGELFATYRKMDIEMAAVSQNVKGVIRIGASTTVAQYVLPKYLARFKDDFPETQLELTAHNTEHVERRLLNNQIDIGIVEGQSKRKQLKYTKFLKDEIVLCTRSANPMGETTAITTEKLRRLPLLIREQGSGTLEVISSALKSAGISMSDLQIEMTLQDTESIKSYLLNSNTFAFLSIHSVLHELASRLLRIVDIRNLVIERDFYFVNQQGDNQPLTALLQRFLGSHHNDRE